jgi:hypothetical protein
MMDETYLMEHIKDALCFVSGDVRKDLALARQRQSVHRWVAAPLGKLGDLVDRPVR